MAAQAALDMCVVADALDRLELRGTVHGIRRAWACPRVAGRVVTVQLGRFEAEAAASAPHLGTRAIEAASAEHMIVIANGGRVEMAGWGGLLSRAGQSRGVRGVIVDGACRDVDEAEALVFPLYARAGVPTTARGRALELATNTVVTIDGIWVAPGDLAIADGAEWCSCRTRPPPRWWPPPSDWPTREASLADQIDRGVPPTEVVGGGYEHMLTRG